MHTGLNTPWNEWDRAAHEVMELTPDLPKVSTVSPGLDPSSTIGLYMDYETIWAFEALGQGADRRRQLRERGSRDSDCTGRSGSADA